MRITWDKETTGLLDESSIDYTASPFKLKPSFKTHCTVVHEHETNKIIAFYDGPTYILDGREYNEEIEGTTYTLKNYKAVEYEHRQSKEFPIYIRECKPHTVVAHNQINFDLLVAKIEEGMLYSIEPDTWCGFETDFVDTMILSKTLNPDRFGGHSLENLALKTGTQKIEFRKHTHIDERFKVFAADMLYYCIYDVLANTEVYKLLEREKQGWNWEDAIKLEKCVADIITRQQHRGFKFDKVLAESNIEELDRLLEERRQRIEPILPPKPATKKFMSDYTPPKRQFKKNRDVAADLVKFAEKIGAEIVYVDDTLEPEKFIFDGKTHELPLPIEPLLTHQVAKIDDTTHIKNWLVGLGWNPSEYKEKDLSVNTKKEKLEGDKLETAINRYVEQTLSTNFCNDRCEHLETTPSKLRARLKAYKEGRAMKVITNPSFTKGQDKEICPNLLLMIKDFPYAKDIVEYLTYKHRRNSILGGGAEWDEDEEPEKGYMSSIRADGRIPTPAGTCDAATSRMKHKVVANIPRTTTLYGEKMRGLFGVDSGFYQIGYDFDSLEARKEAHYCWRYEAEPKAYCNALIMEKPFDVHTMMAERITAMIGRKFERSPAKNVKYGCTYGAQAAKVAKTIGSDLHTGEMVFNAFWEAAEPLALLKEKLQKYWETHGGKKFILGLDGRKVPTRSAHAILNSLFQSGGVICAKKAMVLHDQKLKAAGLSVDFFTEDWKNKPFAQQLIAYHDEAQVEAHKSLVKFKVFRYTDEESEAVAKAAVKQFKEEQEATTGRIWSDISHGKDNYYVALSPVGEMAVESVREAGEYYKLNVPLTAGYVVGRSWAECH